MNDLLLEIKSKANALRFGADSLETDTALGELLLLIGAARSLIDDEWRGNRIETAKGPKDTITHIDLEELGLI